ncbi:MAG TPA: Flp family type IVb pilin [Chloroflexota bacterium]
MRAVLGGNMVSITESLGRDREGATAVEYALMAAAIAGIIVAIVLVLGIKVSGLFDDLNSRWMAP